MNIFAASVLVLKMEIMKDYKNISDISFPFTLDNQTEQNVPNPTPTPHYNMQLLAVSVQ